MARRSDELRGKQIAEAVTGNQIVEGAIGSARNAHFFFVPAVLVHRSPRQALAICWPLRGYPVGFAGVAGG